MTDPEPDLAGEVTPWNDVQLVRLVTASAGCDRTITLRIANPDADAHADAAQPEARRLVEFAQQCMRLARGWEPRD